MANAIESMSCDVDAAGTRVLQEFLIALTLFLFLKDFSFRLNRGGHEHRAKCCLIGGESG